MLSILTACLCLASIVVPSAARITKASIDADRRTSIHLSRPFGFASEGEPGLQLNVSGLKVWESHKTDKEIDYGCFGFYLASPLYDNLDVDAPTGGCWPNKPVEGLHVIEIVTLEDMIQEKDPKDDSGVYSYTETDNRKLSGGLHSLYFVNCCPDKARISFDIITDMYNTVRGEKSYLSIGEIELPTLYLVMCILFTVGTVIWTYTVYSHKSSARRIHYMMIILGVFKVLTLMAQCGMYHYIRITGHPDGWNVAYYIFTFFRSIFLFSIIILIGTGWSYMTPFLGDNEKRVLMIVLPFQVLIDVSVVIIDEFTPATPSWFTWRDLMHFMDIICCCAILFPIAWRIRHLREASATDGKAERSMQQLIMFRHFYIMVVVYVYFTRIVVYLLEAALPAELAWLAPAAAELAALTFYTLTAAQFRPHSSNSYTKLVSEAEIEMSSV